MNVNAFLCDALKTNSRTLYNEINGKNLSNFEFTFQLAKELVLPFIRQRYESPLGLQSNVLKKIRSVLNIVEPVVPAVLPPVPENSVGCCRQCLDSIAGVDYKAKKRKLNNKLKNKCMTCSNIVCAMEGHVFYVCGTCNAPRPSDSVLVDFDVTDI